MSLFSGLQAKKGFENNPERAAYGWESVLRLAKSDDYPMTIHKPNPNEPGSRETVEYSAEHNAGTLPLLQRVFVVALTGPYYFRFCIV